MVDLDRGEPKTLEARRRTGFPHEARQAVPRIPVAIAAEIDARQDDLAVALVDAARDLTEHGMRAAAPRTSADEWDDAEVAGERAAVLHLHERADTVEPRVGLDAADRADVAGDEAGRLLASPRDGEGGRRPARERGGRDA